MNLNLFFNKLTTTLCLGNLLSDVVRVHGGFIHMMYRLNTSSGTYAVKLLNPNIMQRADAIANYLEADRLESIIQKNNIPIIPSLTFDSKKMQKIDGQYFYIYEWFDGKSLKDQDITKLHCQKIGIALSSIHNIDMKNERYHLHTVNIDWNHYIYLAKEQSPLIFDLLYANKELLYESQNNGNTSIHNIPTAISICHNDMDSKNILWINNNFKIIDLECLRYANPYLELLELALCWSGYEECKIDFELFIAFIDAYFGNNPKPTIDWKSIYYSNYSKLEWLEYNVKRALFIECSNIEEQKLGIEQVKKTINHIIYYNNIKDELLNYLK